MAGSTNGYGGQGGPGGPGGMGTAPGYGSPSGPGASAFGAPGGTSMSTSTGITAPGSMTPEELEARKAAKEAKTAAAKAAKQKEAEDFARTQAGIAAQEAGRQSAGFARSHGLNPAQAALLSSQTAGDVYGGAYGTGLFNKLGLDMQKYGIKKGYQSQQNALEQQNTNNLFSGLGTGLSAAALLFSDEDVKTDIKDGYGILERVTKVVNPKTFKVKPEAGGTGETDVGIIAQDLEKTPLASTVVDTPQGKMVDTRKLTTANTGMLSELSKKVDTLYSFLKEASRGPSRAS